MDERCERRAARGAGLRPLDVALVYGLPDGGGFEELTMVSLDPWAGTVRGSFLLEEAVGHELDLPMDGSRLVGMTLRGPDDLNRLYGDARVWLDRADGRVVEALVSRDVSTSVSLGNMMHSLHAGMLFGGAGRWITAAVGLALAALSVLGTWVWLKKTVFRRKPARSAAHGSATSG